MKTIFLGVAALSAIAAAAPAAAQNDGRYRNNGMYNVDARSNIRVRIQQLEARFDAGVRSGAIRRGEADRLHRELHDLSRLERSYSRNGLTGRERSELQVRLNRVRQAIHHAERGQRGYGNGRDVYNYDYRRDDRNDRRDDRWEDRDDRWEDRDERSEDRDRGNRGGVVGSILNNVLGGNTLRVGQRVSANARLGAVPYEYRNQYRDGSGVYYRSDGRQIYQIDARTDVVLRIYGMNR